MTFLKKKNMIKSIQLCKVWGLLHLWKLCTAHSFATFFFCETQLCYLLSAVLNKEQKRIGWNDGARNRVWVVLLFAFVDVSHRNQNDKKLIKLEPASRKQYLKMRG